MNATSQLTCREVADVEHVTTDDAEFVTEIRAAIAAGHVYVAYQPIVDMGSGEMLKVEALARWNHPERGAIPPGEFIPHAERTGVIDDLGEWILEQACRDVVAMREHGVDIDVNVNFSVVQLRHPAVVERTATILARTGLAPDRLWIEVTENVFLDESALAPLRQLNDLGVHLVVDDFGTGFSNYQYISRLPIGGVKIDRSFVAGLGVNTTDTAIVRSVANLGHELGLQVVVEGVETESQRSQLLSFHAQLGQGWLFAPALRPAELIEQFGPSPAVERASVKLPLSSNEDARIAALRACKVLDTAPEAAYDGFVRLASELLATPMAMISLIDVDRQWFKAGVGIDVDQTPREVAFCNYAIAQSDPVFVVPDASADERFAQNPLVVGGSDFRAYAGVVIRSREDLPLGTLCVVDTQPRTFTTQQLSQLTTLAEQVASMLDLRRRTEELAALLRVRAWGTPGNSDNDPVNEGHPSPPLVEVDDGRVIRCGGLTIDLTARRIVLNGRLIEMTVKEAELLTFLARHPGQAFSRSELLEEVWNSSSSWQSSATVTEHVYRLRTKLESDPADPRILCTVRGVGYRFDAPAVGRAPSPEPRVGTSIHFGTSIVAVDAGALSLFCAADPAELIGRHIFEFIAPSSLPAVRSRLEMCAAGRSPGDQVLMFRDLQGAELMVLLRTESTEHDGRPAFRATWREVIDDQRRPVPSVESDYLYGDAVIVTDADMHVLVWSPGAERLYGWLESEVLGHRLDDVVPAQGYREACPANDPDATGLRWDYEARFATRDGAIVPARVSLRTLYDGSGAVDAVVMAHRAGC